MVAVAEPEFARMAKKRPTKPTSVDVPFDRVEFHASPSWVRQLDKAAEALGVSRSAYIRMACIRQMNADKLARQEPPSAD